MIEETLEQSSEQRMDQAGAEVYAPAEVVDFPTQPQKGSPPYLMLGLSSVETLLTFQAYRLLLKHYAAQESEPLLEIQQVVALMATIKPSAIEASKLFQSQGGG